MNIIGLMIFFLSIVGGITNEDDLKCEEYFSNITNSIISGQMPTNLSPQTLLCSGKGIQDLGSYLVCKATPDLHYLDLRMKSSGKPIHWGLCLPQYCSEEYLQQYNVTTKEIINNFTKLQYDKELIDSVIYQDPDQRYPDKNYLFWITIGIVGFVVLLNIFGSAITIIAKSKEKKYLKQNQEFAQINQEKRQIQRYNQQSWMKYAQAFSFPQNYNKLFKVEPPKGENSGFVVFNGIRALSIFWVIYAHESLIRQKIAFNIADAQRIATEIGWITITPAAYFAVDVFFFISGFLAAVLFLEKLTKMKNINFSVVPVMWVHRFFRIWPTYAFCIIIFWQLTIFWSSGPIWGEFITIAQTCNKQWWKNLLFIDNWFTHQNENGGMYNCFSWGWYLSNDFQIFLITPILLMIYAKSRRIGLIILITLLFGSIITAYLIVYQHDYHYNLLTPNQKPQPDYTDVFYIKPYIRISPYIIGILFGLVYRKYINKESQVLTHICQKIKNSILIRSLLYLIGIGLTQTIIWIIIPLQKDMNAWPQQAQYFYQAFNRVFFVIGVAFCITPALLGCKNDPSRIILGHPFWVPIARISFCMYLTHFVVILFMTFSSTQLVYYQYSHILFFTLTDIVYTIIVSIIISLAIEVPCLNIEKIIFTPQMKNKPNVILNRYTEEVKYESSNHYRGK